MSNHFSFLFYVRPLYWKILYFVVIIIVSYLESFNRNDFLIYQLASKDLMNGVNPYSHSYIDGYYYYYSLFFAYIIYPFTFLNPFWSTFVWLFCNGIFLYYIIIEIAEFTGISRYSFKTQFLFYLLIILFNIRVIRENFHSAQITILILFLIIYGLKFLILEKNLKASVLFALAINIKLLALPVLVYLIYRRYWKAVIYTILFVVLLFIIPWIFLDTKFYLDCIKHWWLLINPSNTQHLIDTEERSFHSITTLISTLFLKNPPDVYALPIRRYIMNLDISTVIVLIQLTRALFILSVLYIIKEMPFKTTQNKFKIFFEFAYITALIPLIFPHQQHYAFLLQMPAVSIIILYFLSQSFTQKELLIFIITFLVFNLKILLGSFNEYYDHFKILTYGAILNIFFLIHLSNKFSLK